MQQQSREYADDEISLVDLFLVLNRRKWLVVTAFLLGIAIAFGYSLMQKDAVQYSYTTPLEIGTMLVSGEVIEADSVENLQAKIEQAYIPQLESQLNEKVSISISSPRGSNLIILQSTASAAQLDKYAELHRKLLKLIQDDALVRMDDLGATRNSKTRMISPTQQSKVTKKSQSVSLMTTLGAVLGLFLGIFAAFFAEFVANIRKELQQRQSQPG